MPLVYSEFDTTIGELSVALRNAILTCTEWSKINTNPTIQSTSAAAAINATTLTFTTTTGFAIGQNIKIGSGSTTEYRTLTAVAATTVTFAGGLLNAQASGTAVTLVSEVLKTTTTRGAEMIFEIESASTLALNLAVWRTHTGTVGTDRSQRYVYHRQAAATATNFVVHVTLSVSKEHIFFSLEGPRASETGASSATGGSFKNYFFMDDLVPYHASDVTPVVFAGGGMAAAPTASFANNSHQGHLSRNFANTSPWVGTKLLTLDFPTQYTTEVVNGTRMSTADNKYYLAPYVAFADDSGIRGRLANFFFAGYNVADTVEVTTPPVNQKVAYGGKSYKLIAVNKQDTSNTGNVWGQFGSINNNNSIVSYYRSVVVAIPCTPDV